MWLRKPKPASENTQSSLKQPDLANELAHITQEMYKKNFELAEINKTLSLLRKIDVIVLSSVTDLEQTAQEVVNVVVEDAGFSSAMIYLFDKKKDSLDILAISEATKSFSSELKNKLLTSVSNSNTSNLLMQAILNKKSYSSTRLHDIVTPLFSLEEATHIQETAEIKTVFIQPLIVRNEVIGVLVVLLTHDGVELTSHKEDLIDRLGGVVGIALDNALLYQKIQDANKRLKQLDKLKDEFVSLASHELRTPMTIIKSYLWALLTGKNGQINDKQKIYLERAFTSTQRLIDLVNDMLNISRIESGRFTLDLKNADINKMIQEVVDGMKPRADELGIKLMTEVSDDNPIAIIDPERIEQVLINLIGNSLKFTPEGGVITVRSATKNKRVVIQVSDTGIGMEKDDLPKLFKKFGVVGDNYLSKTNAQGTGLGLYLCKSIIELHKGKILAVSEGRNKGSTFTFYLQSAQNASVNHNQISTQRVLGMNKI